MAHWTESFFGPLYGKIYRQYVLTPDRSRSEVGFASALLKLRGKTILDMAAGFGRHARLLAKTNRVFALDLNRSYLETARKGLRGCSARNLATVRGDMRTLPCRDASMDAVLLLFNSFGYFVHEPAPQLESGGESIDRIWRLPRVFYERQLVAELSPAGQVGKNGRVEHVLAKEDQNEMVLAEIRRVLRPDGDLLAEIPNPAPLVRAITQAPRRRMVTGRYEIEEEFSYDASAQVLMNRTVFRSGKREESTAYRLRLYTPVEFRAALARAGLRVVKAYGSYAGEPFRARTSEMQLLRARPLP